MTILLFITVILMTATAQVLIKWSYSRRDPEHRLFRLLRPALIVGYTMLFLTTVLNVQIYKALPARVAPVAGAATLLLVFALSALLLKEKIDRRRWVGLALILIGILVFFL